MSERILFTSGKGGVGKSTCCAFIGRALAEAGKKVIVLDADAAMGAQSVMLGVADKTLYNWFDVLEGDRRLKRALVNVSEGLSLLACPPNIPQKRMSGFKKLCDMIDSEVPDADYILVDCPAGLGPDFRSAARACGKALIVTTADEISVKCAFETHDELVKEGMASEETRLLLNRFEKKAVKKSRLLNIDGAIDKSGVRLIGILPEEKRIKYLSVSGKMPKSGSNFCLAVKRVAGRIQGKNVLLPLNKL